MEKLVMQSAEPFFMPGGKTGCLLIHGYTGTPKEMRMLGDSLAKEGYTVLAPRLFGHATCPDDIGRARYEDWIACVEDGLNLLKGCTEQQFVMGLSMGGVLTLIAAARYEIAGAVALSTPIHMPNDPRLFLLPLIGRLNIHIGKGASDFQDVELAKDHVDYLYYPSRSIIELDKIIKVMKSELSKVKVPVLVVQSIKDSVVPATSLDEIFNGIGSVVKEKFWVENSGHVVTREPDREVIFARVKTFIQRVLDGN